MILIKLQDLLFNPNKRCGELYEKLVYRQRSKPRNDQKGDAVSAESLNFNPSELIEFFQTCLIPEQYDTLINVLKESVSQRKVDLSGNKEILKSLVHLYMLEPELVG